jgi:hypothetical protein
MKKCYIYSFVKEISLNSHGLQKQNHLVIFMPYKGISKDRSDIQIQLREYFHSNILPDKLTVICFEFNKEEVAKLFEQDSDIYEYIPKFDYKLKHDSINVLSLDKKGTFSAIIGSVPSQEVIDHIYNEGLVRIFNRNGGLIVAQPAHHFVFPSGKHCDRFLRTGNVLIHGADITFIASALVRHFKRETFDSICCDTSSINSLAYAYINLQKELNEDFKNSVTVESFGSYRMFEQGKYKAKRDSIFLISSSTSGSILERMTDKRNKSQNIQLTHVAIIYGLNVISPYNKQVICDLTLSKDNKHGLDKFDSYNVSKTGSCRFCSNGSKPLKVEGDVFLLEKPVVNVHIIKRTSIPGYLRGFGKFYKKENIEAEPIIRCYHKEGRDDRKYEIYIDLSRILEAWSFKEDPKHPFREIFEKLEKYILQNIPASLKYMIILPDEGSEKLAQIICKVLNEHGISFDEKNILDTKSESIKKIDSTQKGVIAVISSSIVTGGNLLYLSRALRDYEKTFQRIFFTFISRTSNSGQLEFLQSNLGMGEFGANSNKIINVETIHCSKESVETSWFFEEQHIKEFQDYLEGKPDLIAFSEYCSFRINELEQCGKKKGLSNNLFFPSLKNTPLAIRSGFAFAPHAGGNAHEAFIAEAKQSEIYFIISVILNQLRNEGVLVQSEYLRNLIDPGNFVRFNDGILQAAILRAANKDELDYSLSNEYSEQIQAILGDMIMHIEDDHAEALNEFFYAIAIKKLKLPQEIIRDCIELLEDQDFYKNNDSILKGIVEFIKDNILDHINIKSKFSRLRKPEPQQETGKQ